MSEETNEAVAEPEAEVAASENAPEVAASENAPEVAGPVPEAAAAVDDDSDAPEAALEEGADSDAPAEEPEEDAKPVVAVRRQSIVLRSGACDMRVGPGVIDQIGNAAKTVAGKPGSVMLLHGEDVSDDVVETVRRSLVDQGFSKVAIQSVVAGRAARTLEEASKLYGELASANITPDDPIVVVGDADVLSLAVFVGSTWQTGAAVVALPTTLDGMVDVTVTPRPLDSATTPEVLRARGNLRYAICDTDLLPAPTSETSLMANAVMVAGAMAAGEANFSDLALRADGIMEGDAATLVEEILDITKARTRVASSTALAMRQGVLYGLSVGRALKACLAEQDAADARLAVETEVSDARLLAEGLRISARLAAARQATDESVVDLVFAQDGLLEKFGLPEVACNVSAERLIEALRADEFSHSNRFMLALPLGYGRVRLNTVEDEMLSEHLGAWCRARKKLARRRAKAAASVATRDGSPEQPAEDAESAGKAE